MSKIKSNTRPGSKSKYPNNNNNNKQQTTNATTNQQHNNSNKQGITARVFHIKTAPRKVSANQFSAGEARQGEARQGKTRQDKTRQDKARSGHTDDCAEGGEGRGKMDGFTELENEASVTLGLLADDVVLGLGDRVL